MNLLLPITCACLFIQPSSKFLVVHPTGSPEVGEYSLPKGVLDLTDISMEAAAARELYEETGVYIMDRVSEIVSLGVFPYTRKKNYFLCYYRSPVEIDIKELVCESRFGPDSLREVDAFDFIYWSQLPGCVNAKQNKILRRFERELHV